jgi:hypothetical protein
MLELRFTEAGVPDLRSMATGREPEFLLIDDLSGVAAMMVVSFWQGHSSTDGLSSHSVSSPGRVSSVRTHTPVLCICTSQGLIVSDGVDDRLLKNFVHRCLSDRNDGLYRWPVRSNGVDTREELARISYRLGLTHLCVERRVISLGKELGGKRMRPVQVVLTFSGGILLSVYDAWLLYVLIEKPELKFARKVQRPNRQPDNVGSRQAGPAKVMAELMNSPRIAIINRL